MMGSQGGPNKMAAVNLLWLHFLGNRSSIQSFFFCEIIGGNHSNSDRPFNFPVIGG